MYDRKCGELEVLCYDVMISLVLCFERGGRECMTWHGWHGILGVVPCSLSASLLDLDGCRVEAEVDSVGDTLVQF